MQEIPAANRRRSPREAVTPVVKNEIRPFVVAARPLVRNLNRPSKNLAKATPNLSKAFGVLNHLFNDLGYFPGGAQHGYLWWLAWGDHNARTVFATQDANGDFRQLFLQASCASYSQIVQNLGPLAAVVLNVAPVLADTGVCPSSGGTVGLARDFQAYQRKRARRPPPRARSPERRSQRATASTPKAGH